MPCLKKEGRGQNLFSPSHDAELPCLFLGNKRPGCTRTNIQSGTLVTRIKEVTTNPMEGLSGNDIVVASQVCGRHRKHKQLAGGSLESKSH